MRQRENEGDAVLALSLRCQKCQLPSHPHHPSSQPPTKWLAQHPNPTPHNHQRLSRLPQRQHSLTLRNNQGLCQQIRSTASKPLDFNRCMGRKNQMAIVMTDIVKILSSPPPLTLHSVVRNDITRTLRTLRVDSLGLRSKAFTLKCGWVAQVVDFEGEVESSKRLKIRVSAVRFCPRPPDSPHSFARGCGVFLWGFSVISRCQRSLYLLHAVGLAE